MMIFPLFTMQECLAKFDKGPTHTTRPTHKKRRLVTRVPSKMLPNPRVISSTNTGVHRINPYKGSISRPSNVNHR